MLVLKVFPEISWEVFVIEDFGYVKMVNTNSVFQLSVFRIPNVGFKSISGNFLGSLCN